MQFIVNNDFVGKRLDFALKELLPNYSLRARRRLCEQAFVLIDDKVAKEAQKLKLNQVITVKIEDEELAYSEDTFADNKPYIISKNDDFVAIYKPSKWHSVHLKGGANNSIETVLPVLCNEIKYNVKLLNRLDYYTSGILLASSSDNASKILDVNRQTVNKYYLCVVSKHIENLEALNSKLFELETKNERRTSIIDFYNFDDVESKKITELINAEYNNHISIVIVKIIQGARHQIRKHMSEIDLPLIGDEKYNGLKADYFLLHHFYFKMNDFEVLNYPTWSDLFDKKLKSTLINKLNINQ